MPQGKEWEKTIGKFAAPTKKEKALILQYVRLGGRKNRLRHSTSEKSVMPPRPGKGGEKEELGASSACRRKPVTEKKRTIPFSKRGKKRAPREPQNQEGGTRFRRGRKKKKKCCSTLGSPYREKRERGSQGRDRLQND